MKKRYHQPTVITMVLKLRHMIADSGRAVSTDGKSVNTTTVISNGNTINAAARGYSAWGDDDE